MSSVQHSQANVGKAESMQQSNSEAKVMRERARYYSMSPDQVETLRQNKKITTSKRRIVLEPPTQAMLKQNQHDPIWGVVARK